MGLFDYYRKQREEPVTGNFSEPEVGPPTFKFGGGGGGGGGQPTPTPQRGVPESININALYGGLGRIFDPTREDDATQLISDLGRAPGFIAERPFVLADTALGAATGRKEEDPGILESLLGGIEGFLKSQSAGGLPGMQAIDLARRASGDTPLSLYDLTSGLFNFSGSVGNYPMAKALRENYGRPDDARPKNILGIEGVTEGAKTVGELREIARQRGFTDQDVEDLVSGARDDWSFHDKMIAKSLGGDLIVRMALDPTNLLLGAGVLTKGFQGIGLLKRAREAGLLAEKAFSPLEAARAIRVGDTAGVTFKGLATWGAEQAGRVVPGRRYWAASTGLTAGQLALEGLATNTDLENGFLEPLYDFSHAAFNEKPLSESMVFSIAAGMTIPFRGLVKDYGVRPARATKRAVFGHDIDSVTVNKLADELGFKGSVRSKKAQIISHFGDEQAYTDLIEQAVSRIALSKIAPNIRQSYAITPDSLGEAIGVVDTIAKPVRDKAARMLAKGEISAQDVWNEIEDWASNARGAKDLTHGVEFANPRVAQTWLEYRPIAAELERLYGGVGQPLLGLYEGVLSKEHIAAARSMLKDRAENGVVSGEAIAEILREYPLIMRNEWFHKFLVADAPSTTLKTLNRRLGSLEKEAPTWKELTEELAVWEREADDALDLVPEGIRPLDAQPMDNYRPMGEATVLASRWRDALAKQLGFRHGGDMGSVRVARGTAPVRQFEDNIGPHLTEHGYTVDQVGQAAGRWANDPPEPSVSIHLSPELTIEQMREAAVLTMRGGQKSRRQMQDAVALVLDKQTALNRGLDLNATKLEWNLGALTQDQMDAVMNALGDSFPAGSTLDDTSGRLIVIVRKSELTQARNSVRALQTALEQALPERPGMGHAYLKPRRVGVHSELIGNDLAVGRSKPVDVSYMTPEVLASDVERSAARNPRYQSALRNGQARLALRPGDPGLAGSGRAGRAGTGAAGSGGPGPGAPDLADPAVLRQRIVDTFGYAPEEADIHARIFEARARAMNAEAAGAGDAFLRQLKIEAGGAPADAAQLQLAVLDQPSLADDLTPVDRRAIVDEPVPQILRENGLGQAAALEWVPIKEGLEFGIPGGLDGLRDATSTFSLWDMWRLRAQAFNPGLLPESIRRPLYAKIFRSHVRSLETDPLDAYNRMVFAMLSPNSNLTANEAVYALTRSPDMDSVKALADIVSEVEPRPRNKTLASDVGFEVQQRLGIADLKGPKTVSTNTQLGNVALLARKFYDNPEWFLKKSDESLLQYAERIGAATPGAQLKVANFGVMLGDPVAARTGTIDSHMNQLLGMGNKAPHAEEITYALKSGINPKVPEHLRDLPGGPGTNNVTVYGGDYAKANEALRKLFTESGIDEFDLGGYQWYLWDAKRGKLEPHPLVYPGAYKLPRMTGEGVQSGYDVLAGAGFTAEGPLGQQAFRPSTGMLYQYPRVPEPWRGHFHRRMTELVPVSFLDQLPPGNTLGKTDLEALKADLAQNGMREPIALSYSAADRTILMDEGNHRLAAARELGWENVPVRFIRYERPLGGVKVPGVDPDEFGYVRGQLRPSEIGVPVARGRLAQGEVLAKGSTEFVENETIIRALESPDLSTLAHEAAHAFIPTLGPSSQKLLDGWIDQIAPKADAYRGQEIFARGFERWLREGTAEVAGLEQVFARFKEWLVGIYRAVRGSPIDQRLTPDVRSLFEDMLTEQRSVAKDAWQAVKANPADDAAVDEWIAQLAKIEDPADLPGQLRSMGDQVNRLYPEGHPARPNLLQALQRADEDLVANSGNRGQVLWNQELDARATAEIPMPQMGHNFETANAAAIRRFNEDLLAEFPAYAAKAPPEVALRYSEGQGQWLRDLISQKGLVGEYFFERGPQSAAARAYRLLFHPVPNSRLARDMKQAFFNELLPKGFKTKDINQFLAVLEADAASHTILGARMFRKGDALLPSRIAEAATASFSPEALAGIGGAQNMWKILDRSSSRLHRKLATESRAKGPRGALARAAEQWYQTFQDTPAGPGSRIVGKTLYPIFRFLLDPRWHAMNVAEADIISATKGGLRATRFGGANKVRADTAALTHQKRRLPLASEPYEEAIPHMDTGFLDSRRLQGKITRSFETQRGENMVRLVDELGFDHPDLVNLREWFPELATDVRGLGEQLDDMLYKYDTQGVKATIDAEARRQLNFEEVRTFEPLLQRLYELNEDTYQGLIKVLHGNASRSNSERVLNSFWLYWPVSYQIKATKWLADTLTGGAGRGHMTGAAYVAYLVEKHKARMADDPNYVAMMEENTALWRAAAMFLPMTPFDMGVTLSRPTRYAGAETGLFEEYSVTGNPIEELVRVTGLGPVYTMDLLKQINRETLRFGADN